VHGKKKFEIVKLQGSEVHLKKIKIKENINKFRAALD